MNLTTIQSLIASTTSSGEIQAFNNFMAYPMLVQAFIAVSAIAGVTLIASIIFWVGRAIGNLVHRSRGGDHWDNINKPKE